MRVSGWKTGIALRCGGGGMMKMSAISRSRGDWLRLTSTITLRAQLR